MYNLPSNQYFRFFLFFSYPRAKRSPISLVQKPVSGQNTIKYPYQLLQLLGLLQFWPKLSEIGKQGIETGLSMTSNTMFLGLCTLWGILQPS